MIRAWHRHLFMMAVRYCDVPVSTIRCLQPIDLPRPAYGFDRRLDLFELRRLTHKDEGIRADQTGQTCDL